MSRDLSGAAMLGIGLLFVLCSTVAFPPQPAGRDIWVVTQSDKGPSRPQLVRAAHPHKLPIRVAAAL